MTHTFGSTALRPKATKLHNGLMGGAMVRKLASRNRQEPEEKPEEKDLENIPGYHVPGSGELPDHNIDEDGGQSDGNPGNKKIEEDNKAASDPGLTPDFR